MKTFFTHFFTTIIFVGAMALQAQNTITIDNTPQSTTTHTTIQAAHDAANDGDIIFVQASPTSYGNVTITKPITIIGRSHSELSNISILSGVNITGGSNITLKGLNIGSVGAYSNTSGSPVTDVKIYECEIGSITFGAGYASTDPRLVGIEVRGCIFNSFNQYADGQDVLISNNIITGSGGGFYNPSKIIVTNNIFRYSSNWNFGTGAPGETVILYNNMFINNSSNRTITLSGTGDFNISNCLTYNYGAGDITIVQSGSTTFQVNNSLENTDPLFTNIDASVSTSMAGTAGYNSAIRLEDDLTLQAGSPALTGGGGGTELGVFNNGFNFKYLGNPRGIPTLDIVTYDGAVPKDGSINVTISAKAQ